MKILALDYDGVLVDSAKESFAVSYNLYIKNHKFKYFSNEQLTPENFYRIDTELKPLEEGFNHLRAFCSIPRSFESILLALDRDKPIKEKREFDKFRKKRGNGISYRIKFHTERARLIKQNFKAFLTLTPPNKEIIQAVKKLFDIRKQVYIITKNKKELLSQVLYAYDLEISLTNIIDPYAVSTKKQGFKKLKKLTGLDYKDMIFIDDSLKYLLETSELGVKKFLANWGFIAKEDLKAAKENKIEILTKQNFYTRLKQELSK